MDDIDKLKRFAKSATAEEIRKEMKNDPCARCPSVKSCIYAKRGMLCPEVAKEKLEANLNKWRR